MAATTIDVEHTTSAAPEAVWRLLADITTWSDWGEWDVARLKSGGSVDGEGVGTVRELHVGRNRSVEKLIVFEPPRRLAYALVGGNLPVRNYRGEVTLEPTADGGTTIRWTSTFKAKVPGTAGIVAGKLRPFLADTARRVGDAAAAV